MEKTETKKRLSIVKGALSIIEKGIHGLRTKELKMRREDIYTERENKQTPH